MFLTLFGYMQNLFLKGSNILAKLAVLFLDKLHLFVRLASQIIMNKLIFYKNFVF